MTEFSHYIWTEINAVQVYFSLGSLKLYNWNWFVEYLLIFYSAQIINLIFILNVAMNMAN